MRLGLSEELEILYRVWYRGGTKSLHCSCVWTRVKSGCTIIIVGCIVEKIFRLKGLDVAFRLRVNQDKLSVPFSLSPTLLLSQCIYIA